jgi:hypothetical protein
MVRRLPIAKPSRIRNVVTRIPKSPCALSLHVRPSLVHVKFVNAAELSKTATDLQQTAHDNLLHASAQFDIWFFFLLNLFQIFSTQKIIKLY